MIELFCRYCGSEICDGSCKVYLKECLRCHKTYRLFQVDTGVCYDCVIIEHDKILKEILDDQM